MHKAKILRLHFSENDRFEGRPLHEAIVDKCREMQIAGATVFRGLEGYGESAEIHRSRVMSHHQPIVIVIVDGAERIAALVPVIKEMMETGLLAISNAEVERVERVEG